MKKYDIPVLLHYSTVPLISIAAARNFNIFLPLDTFHLCNIGVIYCFNCNLNSLCDSAVLLVWVWPFFCVDDYTLAFFMTLIWSIDIPFISDKLLSFGF